MTLTEAIEILRTHNEWRRGAEIEPTDPIILGEAIDTIVNSYIIKPWVTYSDSVESDSSTQPIQGDISNEYRYAKEFATIVHARCYPESPQWQPLPDLFGLLTQIDNMFCGLERKPTPTDTARAEDVVDLCKAIQENTHSPRCWSEIEKAIRNYAAPIRAELERLKCELSNNQKADISIADLRKVFAHRASRITEELNQGANQLMTLSDFRIAVADMGWRIGFDQIGELQSQLSAANQRIAELEEQNKKYWFMIEHGLGVEDITPPTYPHP